MLLVLALVLAAPPACTLNLRCPEGAKTRSKGDTTQCTRPDGIPDGPGFLIEHRLQLRRGKWTRFFPSGKRRFECDLHGSDLVGTCTAWNESGKQVGTATYDEDGYIVTGTDVQPYFLDEEVARPLKGRPQPVPVDLASLITRCPELVGKEVTLEGAVLGLVECPPCPRPRTMCKTCDDSGFTFGDATHSVKVVSNQVLQTSDRLRLNAVVQTGSPCTLSFFAAHDLKTGRLISP